MRHQRRDTNTNTARRVCIVLNHRDDLFVLLHSTSFFNYLFLMRIRLSGHSKQTHTSHAAVAQTCAEWVYSSYSHLTEIKSRNETSQNARHTHLLPRK